jgi:hypothetical protein
VFLKLGVVGEPSDTGDCGEEEEEVIVLLLLLLLLVLVLVSVVE